MKTWHLGESGNTHHELMRALVVVERPKPGQVDDAVGPCTQGVRWTSLAGGVNSDYDGRKRVLAARLRGGRPTWAIPAQWTDSGAVRTFKSAGRAETARGTGRTGCCAADTKRPWCTQLARRAL